MIEQQYTLNQFSATYYCKFHKRVYNILNQRGYLDENEIVKLCFMPPRDVRAIINTLFQDNIIEIQEVPNKSGNFITLFFTNPTKVQKHFNDKTINSLTDVLYKIYVSKVLIQYIHLTNLGSQIKN